MAGLSVERPRLHATPRRGWMNDPNGLVYDDGVYHLFFQHQPDSLDWGPMHWGHLASRDLLTWEERPVALAPDEDGVVFSGSVVREPGGPLVAFYTRVAPDGAEAQCRATSDDGGNTWEREGPVLLRPAGVADFRDPKVLRHGTAWVMLLAVGDEVWFHHSDDLRAWTRTGRFGRGYGAHGGVWEMPDLLQLGDDWVLTVSVNDGGPAGGSGAQYFVGTFDGDTFQCPDPPERIRWVDRGPDFYAPQSWFGVPDGRTLWIGWMSNWAYAGRVPATTWRGSMTVVREVGLEREGADAWLTQRPVGPVDVVQRVPLGPGGVHLLGNGVLLGRDDDGDLVLDRSSACPPGGEPVVRAHLPHGTVEVDLVRDEGSVEVFANGGRVVLTALTP